MSIRYQNIGNAEDYDHTHGLRFLNGESYVKFNSLLAAEEFYTGMKQIVDEEDPTDVLDYRPCTEEVRLHPQYTDIALELAAALEEGKTAEEIAEELEP